ncbi:hypothetical protein NUW54_g10107 [Trametes sanguinea]|uniref:Uncharacterized protein n=1 Tax=Trametes sanguinea TaxID=158606 RepID=A0ACC1P2S0_9APHY|nr:hypothetical protein NUW54_g10107 [Trametes sanguinea]
MLASQWLTTYDLSATRTRRGCEKENGHENESGTGFLPHITPNERLFQAFVCRRMLSVAMADRPPESVKRVTRLPQQLCGVEKSDVAAERRIRHGDKTSANARTARSILTHTCSSDSRNASSSLHEEVERIVIPAELLPPEKAPPLVRLNRGESSEKVPPEAALAQIKSPESSALHSIPAVVESAEAAPGTNCFDCEESALQEGATSPISRSPRSPRARTAVAFDAEKVSRTMEAKYSVDVLGHGTSFLDLTRIDLS